MVGVAEPHFLEPEGAEACAEAEAGKAEADQVTVYLVVEAGRAEPCAEIEASTAKPCGEAKAGILYASSWIHSGPSGMRRGPLGSCVFPDTLKDDRNWRVSS